MKAVAIKNKKKLELEEEKRILEKYSFVYVSPIETDVPMINPMNETPIIARAKEKVVQKKRICEGIIVTQKNRNIFEPFFVHLDEETFILDKTKNKIGIVEFHQGKQGNFPATIHAINCYNNRKKKEIKCQTLRKTLCKRHYRIKTRTLLKPYDGPIGMQIVHENLKKENIDLKKENKKLKKVIQDIEGNKQKFPIFSSILDSMIRIFSSGEIEPNHFFLKIVETGMNNLTRKIPQYDDDTYKFGLYLRFLGGEKLIEVLRGEGGKKFNISLPCNESLGKRIPDGNLLLGFNTLEKINLSPGNHYLLWDEVVSIISKIHKQKKLTKKFTRNVETES